MKQLYILFLQLPLLLLGQWQMEEPIPGPGRDDAIGVYANGKIYAGAGRDASFYVNRDWWAYDIAGKFWTNLGHAAFSNRQYALTCVNDKDIYVLGGVNGNGDYLQDAWVFHTENQLWSALPDFPYPIARGVLFYWNNRLYAGLGRNANHLIDEIYALTADEWVKITEFPADPRYSYAYFHSGNRLYIGWGTDLNDSLYSDWWTFSMADENWQSFEGPDAAPRSWAASTPAPQGGGYTGFGMTTNEKILNDCWFYNPILKRWASIPSDIARRGSSLIATETDLHLIWGLDSVFSRQQTHFTLAAEQIETNTIVYPNPCNEFITLAYISSTQKSRQWRVFDISGKQIDLLNCPSGQSCRYGVSHLKHGMYFFRNMENGETIKFMVVREK